MLRRLCRNCDPNDPDSVERFVFDLQVSNKTRNIFFDAYTHYCRVNEIQWTRPKLKVEAYPVKVPTGQRINLVISASSRKYATIFQISKHGLRPDEISKITLRDVGLDNGTLLVRSSKLGLERTIRLKQESRDLVRARRGI